MARKFKLGQVVTTIGVLELCRHGMDLGPYIDRHVSGDWGDIDARTHAANERAVLEGGRIMSVYHPAGRRIWIVTEPDRKQTTILFPHEKDGLRDA